MVIFVVWIAFTLLYKKTKLQSHKRIYENTYFCNIIMLSEGTNILEFHQYQKSDKAPFTIYAVLECKKREMDLKK